MFLFLLGGGSVSCMHLNPCAYTPISCQQIQYGSVMLGTDVGTYFYGNSIASRG